MVVWSYEVLYRSLHLITVCIINAAIFSHLHFFTVDDVDECLESNNGRGPCSHQCLNTIGSYKCLCPAGATLQPDGVNCIFITCPKCMHGGYCDSETNKCVCPAGFTGDICEKGELYRLIKIDI